MRPQHAQELTGALATCLSSASEREPVRASRRLVQSIMALPSPVEVRGWQWTLRHPPGDDVALHNVAWDSDGHCLAAATDGLRYWSGTSWSAAPTDALPGRLRLRCAHRVRAGTWLIAGDDVIAVYSANGIQETLHCPTARFQLVGGHIDDLLLGVSDGAPQSPELWVLSGRRWLAPAALRDLVSVSAIARLRTSEWLVAGRRQDGVGALGLCRALDRSLSWFTIPPTRAIVACASQPDRELGLAVGTHGVTVSVHPGGVTSSTLEGEPNLSACALDILDRQWAAAAGRLWVKEPGAATRWRVVWEDAGITSPFVGILADVGLVLAVTADGGILEGRAPWSLVGPLKTNQVS